MNLNREKSVLVIAARRFYYASAAPVPSETQFEYAEPYSSRRVAQCSELIEALQSPVDDETCLAIASRYGLAKDLKEL